MISFSQIANPWLGTVIGMGNGWKAGHALRLKPDHLIGAGQISPKLKRFGAGEQPALTGPNFSRGLKLAFLAPDGSMRVRFGGVGCK